MSKIAWRTSCLEAKRAARCSRSPWPHTCCRTRSTGWRRFVSELSGRGVSRRRFLQAVPLSAIALAACDRRPYNTADFVLPARSNVALLPASTYDADLTDLIVRGLRMLDQDIRGKRVFLKPNMV